MLFWGRPIIGCLLLCLSVNGDEVIFCEFVIAGGTPRGFCKRIAYAGPAEKVAAWSDNGGFQWLVAERALPLLAFRHLR